MQSADEHDTSINRREGQPDVGAPGASELIRQVQDQRVRIARLEGRLEALGDLYAEQLILRGLPLLLSSLLLPWHIMRTLLSKRSPAHDARVLALETVPRTRFLEALEKAAQQFPEGRFTVIVRQPLDDDLGWPVTPAAVLVPWHLRKRWRFALSLAAQKYDVALLPYPAEPGAANLTMLAFVTGARVLVARSSGESSWLGLSALFRVLLPRLQSANETSQGRDH